MESWSYFLKFPKQKTDFGEGTDNWYKWTKLINERLRGVSCMDRRGGPMKWELFGVGPRTQRWNVDSQRSISAETRFSNISHSPFLFHTLEFQPKPSGTVWRKIITIQFIMAIAF